MGEGGEGWVSVEIVEKRGVFCTLSLLFQSCPLKVIGSYSKNYSKVQMLKGKNESNEC